MKKELYFDIGDETAAGSLYRMSVDGTTHFLYQHSTYDADRDETFFFEDRYETFDAFWLWLLRKPMWFYQHPLFVHPEQRERVREALKGVQWSVHPDPKWQASHQRQWKKVLEDPAGYYEGPGV